MTPSRITSDDIVLFREAFEQASDAMVVLDSAGRVVAANSGAEKLLGLPEGGAAGWVMGGLLPPGWRDRGAFEAVIADGEGGRLEVEVTASPLDVEDRDELVEAVAAVAGVEANDTSVAAVGPTFGSEITRRAIEALVIFLVVVALFITWRFEWKMAIAALAALFHDLIITAGVYSIIGFEVTPATVIAILTILGYSLYDTVVVFDKITENVHELGSRHTFTEIANLSMNQVLMRSINTSATSLLPIGSLLLVGSYLLGAATLREFALALFIGIAAGTYSSIFVASPLLAEWKESEPEWQRMQRRETPLVMAEAAAATATETKSTGATPRAPRKRRKRR